MDVWSERFEHSSDVGIIFMFCYTRLQLLDSIIIIVRLTTHESHGGKLFEVFVHVEFLMRAIPSL